MRRIADSVGATFVVDMAHVAGLVAGGVYPSPIPHAPIVTTTTQKTLRGAWGAIILCENEHQKAIDSAVFPGIQGGPLMHAIAAKAVCFGEALKPEFKTYTKQVVVNAKALAARLMERGLRLVSGGTDNHLMLVDLRPQKRTGKQVQDVADTVGITLNRNSIPYDEASKFNPSSDQAVLMYSRKASCSLSYSLTRHLTMSPMEIRPTTLPSSTRCTSARSSSAGSFRSPTLSIRVSGS